MDTRFKVNLWKKRRKMRGKSKAGVPFGKLLNHTRRDEGITGGHWPRHNHCSDAVAISHRSNYTFRVGLRERADWFWKALQVVTQKYFLYVWEAHLLNAIFSLVLICKYHFSYFYEMSYHNMHIYIYIIFSRRPSTSALNDNALARKTYINYIDYLNARYMAR